MAMGTYELSPQTGWVSDMMECVDAKAHKTSGYVRMGYSVHINFSFVSLWVKYRTIKMHSDN